MFNYRALVSVDAELPTFDPRLVQGLWGEGAAVSRRLMMGEDGEAAEAPHRHGGALGSSRVRRFTFRARFPFFFPLTFTFCFCLCLLCKFRDNGDGESCKWEMNEKLENCAKWCVYF